MLKSILCLATLSLALADGPKFTVSPKTVPGQCVDTKPLSGSDVSYASLQPCAFNEDGTPVVTQLFQFETQSPVADDQLSERLYGFYPDGRRDCFGDAPIENSPFEDHTPPSVGPCLNAAEDAYRYKWWFSEWGAGTGFYQFRKAKPGRYGLHLTFDLRPLNRTGHGEQLTPVVWRIGSEETQRWTVKVY